MRVEKLKQRPVVQKTRRLILLPWVNPAKAAPHHRPNKAMRAWPSRMELSSHLGLGQDPERVRGVARPIMHRFVNGNPHEPCVHVQVARE